MIRFLPSDQTIRVARGTTLLEAALQAGLPIASACGAGGLCARCGIEILATETRLPPESDDEREAKSRNRIDPGLRLSCQLSLDQGVVVTAPYW